MQQSHQDMVASLTSFSATSSTFTFLFKALFTVPAWYLFAIDLEPISRPLSLSLPLSPLSLSPARSRAPSPSLSLSPSLPLSPALSVARSRVKRCCQARQDTLHTVCSRPTATRMLTQQALAVVCSSVAKTRWLRALHFQRLQALLPFFSKSLPPLLHGTCLRSVLSP